MAANYEKILEEVGNLTVIELADLVKAFENKFGVSAAMPVSGGAVATADAGASVAQAEKTEYKVTLKDSGAEKIKVIKALRSVVTGLSLSDAKTKVESAPIVLVEAASKEDANKIKKELEEAGAKVELS